jgi:hypothetical protein
MHERSVRALHILTLGFLIEAGTEVFQIAASGRLTTGAVFGYYASLATTVLGLVVVAWGVNVWRQENPPARSAAPGRVPWMPLVMGANAGAQIAALLGSRISPLRRRFGPALRAVSLAAEGAFGVFLFLDQREAERRPNWWRPWRTVLLLFGGAIAVAALAAASGLPGPGGAPLVLLWLVGGVVVWAFGSFFDNLRRVVASRSSRVGGLLSGVALAVALVVAVGTGALAGNASALVLRQLVSAPSALPATFAPIASVMAFLLVSYLLLGGAAADAVRTIRRRDRAIALGLPPERRGTSAGPTRAGPELWR